jgi:hypothetical protein
MVKVSYTRPFCIRWEIGRKTQIIPVVCTGKLEYFFTLRIRFRDQDPWELMITLTHSRDNNQRGQRRERGRCEREGEREGRPLERERGRYDLYLSPIPQSDPPLLTISRKDPPFPFDTLFISFLEGTTLGNWMPYWWAGSKDDTISQRRSEDF